MKRPEPGFGCAVFIVTQTVLVRKIQKPSIELCDRAHRMIATTLYHTVCVYCVKGVIRKKKEFMELCFAFTWTQKKQVTTCSAKSWKLSTKKERTEYHRDGDGAHCASHTMCTNTITCNILIVHSNETNVRLFAVIILHENHTQCISRHFSQRL